VPKLRTPGNPGFPGKTDFGAPTPGSIEAGYGPAVDGDGPSEIFIVELHGRPIGLVQRHLLNDNPDWKRAPRRDGTRGCRTGNAGLLATLWLGRASAAPALAPTPASKTCPPGYVHANLAGAKMPAQRAVLQGREPRIPRLWVSTARRAAPSSPALVRLRRRSRRPRHGRQKARPTQCGVSRPRRRPECAPCSGTSRRRA
jgi:hypothetical protein